MISKDSVAHVASLAKLQFSEADLEKYTGQLSEILDMVEQLESIHLENVMRPDVAKPSEPVAELLKNVPTKKGTYIQVPAIIDKEED